MPKDFEHRKAPDLDGLGQSFAILFMFPRHGLSVHLDKEALQQGQDNQLEKAKEILQQKI